jgi:hypothetical protein
LINLFSSKSEFRKFGTFEIYFLVEYHGKTELDGEFGRIKKALKIIRLGVVMKTIGELIKGLRTKFLPYNTVTTDHMFEEFVFFGYFLKSFLLQS